MPPGSLDTIARDRDFPALANAASPSFVSDCIAKTPALAGGGWRLTGLDVLNHKPGRRCTIRYHLTSGDASTSVIGKWYRDAAFATQLGGWLEALAVHHETMALPRPLFTHPDGLLLQEYVEGRDLRDLVVDDDLSPYADAGRWLAQLHALAALPGLQRKTPHHEQDKVEAWADEIRPAMQQEKPLDDAVTCLRLMAVEMPSIKPVMIHRDYYAANLIWDGARVWGLDFDQLALGDPAVDVASFITQLEKLMIRDHVPAALYDAKRQAFLDAYGEVAGEEAPLRIAFFTGYTFLHLAAAEVQRKRPGWQELATTFVARAREVAVATFDANIDPGDDY